MTNKEKVDLRKIRGAKTRKQVIEAAREILSEKGLEGLTSRALAERAGIGRGSLFHHFANMDELHQQIIYSLYDDFFTMLEPVKNESVQALIARQFRTAVEFSSGENNRRKLYMAVLDIVRSDPELMKSAVEMFRVYIEGLRTELTATAPKGANSRYIDHTALAVYVLGEGIGLISSMMPGIEFSDEMIDYISAALADRLESSGR